MLERWGAGDAGKSAEANMENPRDLSVRYLSIVTF